MWAAELNTQGTLRAEVCQAEICVKIFNPRKSQGGREGRRKGEDANLNKVQRWGWGAAGSKKHWGGHPFFMRHNGS